MLKYAEKIKKTGKAYWRRDKKKLFSSFLIKLVMYMLLFGISYLCLFPFFYMIITSIKSYTDILDPTVNWIPKSFKLLNYKLAFETMQYPKYFLNSVIITLGSTVGHILGATFIGYGFARYRFPLKKVLFFFVILSIIVPFQTLLFPTYATFTNFKWINTYLPMIVPAFFGFGLKGGLFVFLSNQHMLGIPKEMEEAAKIDGCSFVGTFFRVVLPIAKPLMLVISVLSMVWHWNDVNEASIFISDKARMPLPLSLDSLELVIEQMREQQTSQTSGVTFEAAEQFFSDYNIATLMAGSVLLLIPIIIVFAFLQNKFIEGVERSGLVE